MKNIKQTIINTILPIISTLAVAGLVYAAWTEPTATPPNDNVAAPINISDNTQYKSGALGIGGVFQAFSSVFLATNPGTKVGIGTTSPDTKLDIVGGKAQADDFCLQDNSKCLSNIGGGGGQILAYKVYYPSNAVAYRAGTSYSDVDSSNLAITFTAPSSGRVLVEVTGLAHHQGCGTTFWSIREGSANLPSSEAIVVLAQCDSGDPNGVSARVTHRVVVSELTPGSVHTYKLGHRYTGGSEWATGCGGYYASGEGGHYGQCVMVITSLP